MQRSRKKLIVVLIIVWLFVNTYGCFRTNKVTSLRDEENWKIIDYCIQYRWGTLLASSLVLSGSARKNIQSYLNLAAACDNKQAMRILRFFGADFGDGDDDKGATALHEAAAYASRDSIKMLIDSGVDPNIRDNCGLTPLHYLTKSGPGNVCFWNLVRTAQTNRQISYEVNCETMNILISRGADVSAITDRGETPIFYAAKRKKKYYVKRLIETGADLNAVNQDGETPLDYATQFADDPFNQFDHARIGDLFEKYPTVARHKEVFEEHQTENFLLWLREQGALTGEELRARNAVEQTPVAAP